MGIRLADSTSIGSNILKIKKRGRPRRNERLVGSKEKRNILEYEAGEFVRVCQFGQLNIVKSLLRKGVDINEVDKLAKNTGLHEAASNSHIELVKVLIKQPKIDILAENLHKQTASEVAANAEIKELLLEMEDLERRKRKSPDLRRLIAYLRAEETASGYLDCITQDGPYPAAEGMILAARFDKVDLMKELKTRHPDKFEEMAVKGDELHGYTALHEACRYSSGRVVQYLLDIGTSVFVKDKNGRLPSEYLNSKEVLKIFRKYAKTNTIDDPKVLIDFKRDTMLDEMQQHGSDRGNGDDGILDTDNNHDNNGDDSGSKFNRNKEDPSKTSMSSTATTTTSLSREERKLQQLLGILERADQTTATTGNSIREIAAVPKKTSLTTASNSTSGAKRGPGRPRKNSLTSLSLIPLTEEEETKYILSTIPQDPEDGIFNPSKPRDYKKKKRKATETVGKLGRDAVSTLSKSSHELGTAIPARNDGEEEGVKATFDPLIKDKATNRTLLHKAASRGNFEKAKGLLSLAPELINTQDNGGYTPLHEAALKGYSAIVKLLIDAGAVLSLKSTNGDTALHDASENGHLDVVRLLVEAGADPLVENNEGHGAVEVAYDEVYQWYEARGLKRKRVLETATSSNPIPKRRSRNNSAENSGKLPTEKPEKSIKATERKPASTKKSADAFVDRANDKSTKSIFKDKANPVLKDKPMDTYKTEPTLIDSQGVLTEPEPESPIAGEKIVLLSYRGAWHFLSNQIEDFYHSVLGDRDFRRKNHVFYKNKRLSPEELARLRHHPLVRLPHPGDIQLLEKEAVYSVFRKDGVPLGTVPVVYIDLAACECLPRNPLMTPKLRIKDK